MKNKKGFTLVELLLVITVTTILFGTIITVFVQTINMYQTDESKSSNQTSINIASAQLNSYIRKAVNVYTDANGCHVVTSTADNVFSLNTSTKVLSINGAALTGRITQFTCTNTNGTVTVNLQTINDNKGSNAVFNTTIVIRK